MNFVPDEIDALVSRIDVALAGRRIDAWQRQFLIDIRKKATTYGPRTRLSEKQVAKLEQIVGPWRQHQVVQFQPHHHKGEFQAQRPAPRTSSARSNFRWKPRRRSYRLTSRAITLGFLVVLVGVAALNQQPQNSAPSHLLSLPAASSAASAWISREDFDVTDGDTIHLNGQVKGMRLVGFNAPEVFSPRCANERNLGLKATARLESLVATSSLQLQRVRCSCSPGTEGTDKCNYGRSCGILRANGEDVGQILISEGLAIPFVCGTTSCPPTPRPWCQ